MEFLWEPTQKIRESVLKQGKEVFAAHQEEVFRAIRVVCRCSDLVESERQWFGEPDESGERCVDGMRALKDLKMVLEKPEQYLGEELPLQDFLRAYVNSLLETSSVDNTAEQMVLWFQKKQYTGCQAMQAYIYLLGLHSIGCTLVKKPDFFERVLPVSVLFFFESIIPDGGRKAYRYFSDRLLEELEKKRTAYMVEADKKLRKMQEL